MKVLFDHPNPFLLAHGGFQIQIEQTRLALQSLGVEVEWLRWWDAGQAGHIIHYFGRLPPGYAEFAHGKGFKVVMSELLTGLGARSTSRRSLQKLVMQSARFVLPNEFIARLAWDAYRQANCYVALTIWEKELMEKFFGAEPDRVFVVPNGVEQEFLHTPALPRGKWLVCSATITPRKRVLELTNAAICARVPLWILGKPYAAADEYYLRFLESQRRAPELIRFEGEISDRTRLAEVYREARGFVLLSEMESLSLSALEAAACECPLLLSDLPWARSTFGTSAKYCPVAPLEITSEILRKFYDAPSAAAAMVRPLSWPEVAEKLRWVYQFVSTAK